MVKKNLVNKNVIRALSIGLSVAMMSQPLTAMAANEGEESGSSNNNQIEEKVDNTSAAQKAEAQAEVVDTAVNEDKNGAVDLSKEAASKANDLGFDVSKVNADVDTIETEDKIGDVKDELQTITSETEGEALLPSLEEGVNTAEGSVKAVVDNAYDSVFGNDEKEIESLDTKLTNADTAVKEASGKISGAKTTGEANNAYADAAGAVKEADDAVNAAEEAVQTAEKELTVAKDDYDSLAEKYELALETYNTLVEKLNTAKAKALEAAGIEDNKATEENEEVVGLTQELANAEADLAALKQAVSDAEKAYKESGYGYIAALENAIIKNNGASFASTKYDKTSKLGNVNIEKVEDENDKTKANYRHLFKAIVETYYVPEVLGEKCQFVKLEAIPFDGANPKYYYNGDTTDSTNESTPGDVLRCFKLTYKDANGKEQSVLLNYKTANENNEKGYKGIVIFEKTKHAVLEGKDIDNFSISEENGTVVKLNGEDALLVDGKFYYKDADGKFTVLVQNGEKRVDTEQVKDSAKADLSKITKKGDVETETDVLEDTEEVSYEYVDDRLVKTVKNSITTTTYTGCQLDAMDKDDYKESLADAKADYLVKLQGQITSLRDNMTIIINGEEYDNTYVIPDDADAEDYGFVAKEGKKTKTQVDTIGYQVEVEYKSDFVKKVNVDREYSWEIIKAWVKLESPKSNMKNQARKDEEKAFKNALSSEFAYDGRGSDNLDAEWHVFRAGTVDGTIDFKYHRKNNSKKIIDVYYDDQIKDQAAAKTSAERNSQVSGTSNIGNNTTEKKTVVNSVVKNAITRTTNPEVTTYGYKALNFILKEVATSKEKQITYVESWAVDAEKEHTEYRNDNWYSGNVISISVDKNNNFVADYLTDGKSQGGNQEATVQGDFVSKSVNLVEKINAAKAQIKLYDEAKEAVADAEAQVKAAENEVGTLKNLISQIEDHTTKQSILNDLRTRLGQAKDELEAAKTRRDQLLEDLKKLDGQRDQKVKDLTPSGEGGGDTTSDDDTTAGIVVLDETLADAPVANVGFAAPAAPGVGGGAAAPAAAEGADANNLVNIDNTRAATSDAVPADTTNIEQQAATAAAPINEETMAWWWLLIIAVLGGTGYAMYRKYQAKKEEKVTK